MGSEYLSDVGYWLMAERRREERRLMAMTFQQRKAERIAKRAAKARP